MRRLRRPAAWLTMAAVAALAEGGPPEQFLQIEGDGATVSFHVSRRPYVPTIRGDAVHIGGHVFAATPTPNAFLVDGRPHALPSGATYIFSDGEYGGRLSRR